MSFTIDELKYKGFEEHNPSYGRWEYSRYYDEVPEEVQKKYDEDRGQFRSMEFEGKEYRERNLYRGDKPYFWVYDGLVCSVFSKKSLELTVHYHKDTGIVEYVYCCLPGSCYLDNSYIEYDCRRISLNDVMGYIQNRLNNKLVDENNDYMKKLDDLFTSHKEMAGRLKEKLEVIENLECDEEDEE